MELQTSDSRDVSSAKATPQEVTGILTLRDVAIILRCSKAHISNLICGKVGNLPPIPVVRLGRRVLIREKSLFQWMLAVEKAQAEVR